MRKILFAGMLALLGACSSRPPHPQPPTPPTPSPVCIEGQATCCWHRPPENEWLYACPMPEVPGGVLNVAGGPAQCPGQRCANPDPTPTPTPPPTGDVPAKGIPQGPERLLRNNANKSFVKLDGVTRVDPFMAVPCCMGWAKVPNQLWPMASELFMDETAKYGADMFHFRIGPWFGDDSAESEWTGIGGAYLADGSWNPAFWTKVRGLAWHAFQKNAWVEVVAIDSWWLKNACGKDATCDKRVPWPEADVRAYGVTMTPIQEALIRKTVEELGCFGNVIWATGNEEDLIPRMTADYLNRLIEVTRDEETKSGCNFVHVMGSGSFKAGVNSDYQITHERSPVTGPCNGKLCVNNEHNPEFSPEEEASRFAEARSAGQVWAAWRAGAEDPQWEKRLELFRQVAGGTAPPVGCFAPPADDPLWVDPPVSPAVRPAQMMAAMNAAKAAVGDRCGATPNPPCVPTPDKTCAPPLHEGCLETLGLLAAELRSQGYCASGPWVDAVAILAPDGLWEEYHSCSTGDGCYTGNPYKFAHRYGGSNPTPPPSCSNPDPLPVTKWNVKVHTQGPNWTTVDSTPLACDQAYCAAIGFTDGRSCCSIRQEGDPQREACEAQVVGTPVWSGPPGGQVVPGNAYMFRVPRGTAGTAKVCTSVMPQVCGETEVLQ